MAKNKIKKKPGRMSLKDRLLYRLWCKDQQIAALLRGRDMRDCGIKGLQRQNEMAMRTITAMLGRTGGILALSAQDIMDAEIDSIGVYENTEDHVIYVGRYDMLRAVVLKKEDNLSLPEAAEDESSGVEDVLGTMKAKKKQETFDGDDIDIEAIDDQNTKELLKTLRAPWEPYCPEG